MTIDRPARGTRPPNRRDLIVAAAGELFAARGYENVGMNTIADAVAVGPSALYRHFPGKEELLAAVVADIAARIRAAMGAPGSPVGILVGFALDHRSAGVLWGREARHLPPAVYASARTRMREARDHLAAVLAPHAGTVAIDEARLRADAVLGVVFSPSFHRVDLPRPAFDTLLTGLAQRVLDTELPPRPAADAVRVTGLARHARRERILRVATELFAERTYASVGMEDVAAAAGLAPSSMYNHFAGKAELLSSVLLRGNGHLQLTLEEIFAHTADAATALRALVAAYARFTLDHPALVDVLITEARSLPAEDGTPLASAQRDYVYEWVHLYRTLRPELTAGEAMVVVRAALMMINDLARGHGVRHRPDAVDVLRVLTHSVLGLDQPASTQSPHTTRGPGAAR